jgi:hypothetical protein
MDLKTAKTKFAEYRLYFAPLMGKPVSITLGKISLPPMILTDVIMGKIGELHNAPDKRQDGDKAYTPPVMQLLFGDDTIDIVIQDIASAQFTMNGCSLLIGDTLYGFSTV